MFFTGLLSPIAETIRVKTFYTLLYPISVLTSPGLRQKLPLTTAEIKENETQSSIIKPLSRLFR